MSSESILLLYLAFVALIPISLAIYITPIGAWIKVKKAGINLTMLELIGMRIRRIPPGLIVDAFITADKSSLKISREDLEVHYLCGGNVLTLVGALISANKASIDLSFKTAIALDLAGRDVQQIVQRAINNKEKTIEFI